MADTFNAADYLVLKHLADGRGDHPAVVAAGSELSYLELADALLDVAAAYRHLGLRPDDRVMLLMADDIPMLSAILGAFAAGVVAVPVSTMLNGSELAKILADSGARSLIFTPEFAEAAHHAVSQVPAVEHVVRVGQPGVGDPAPTTDVATWLSWDEFVADGRSASGSRAVTATSPDSWALWLYTSGTTGTPKAAMHRHANIRAVCATYGQQVLDIQPSDRTFSVAKMFFAYGIGNSVFFPFSVGATTVLEPRRPTPDVVAARVVDDAVTLFFGVPTFYAALVASRLPDDTFAGVRLAASAGESLPAPLQSRFTERFGVDVLDGIGSTEALHIFLSNRPGEIRPGTTGRAVPGYDVEVRDVDGNVLPAGSPGGLYVRGDSIALGYWHRTEASRLVFQGQWLSTGDTYEQDADGYYRCLGRNSDMLKAGGIWVSPAEVESRLLEHPAVLEASVIGVPDTDGLDKPVAVVVVQGDPDADELVRWCREGLAHFKAPRQVYFVAELPKTATGKLQRFKVRDLVSAGAVGPGPTSSGLGPLLGDEPVQSPSGAVGAQS